MIIFEGEGKLSDRTAEELQYFILEVIEDDQFNVPIIRIPDEGELEEIDKTPQTTPVTRSGS